jgi:hypothetical protein
MHNDYMSLLLIIAIFIVILYLFRPNLEGAQKPLLVQPAALKRCEVNSIEDYHMFVYL